MTKFQEAVQGFSGPLVKAAVKLILDNNIFHFDRKFFLQISGTAMGTKMATKYATLAEGYIEEMLYTELRKNQGDTHADCIIEN